MRPNKKQKEKKRSLNKCFAREDTEMANKHIQTYSILFHMY